MFFAVDFDGATVLLECFLDFLRIGLVGLAQRIGERVDSLDAN